METTAKKSHLLASAVSPYVSEIFPDRTCHLTHDFDEIVVASLNAAGDFRCSYCISHVSDNEDQFKNHLLRVHFTFSYNYMLDDLHVCVLPCRRGCIRTPQQGNRSHFHCPSCARVYSRKPALSHHIEAFKGRCVPVSVNKVRLSSSGPRVQRKALSPIKASSRIAKGFEDVQSKNRQETSSYTIVVDQDSNALEGSSAELSKVCALKENREVLAASSATSTSNVEPEMDAAGHFGKTVSFRLRGLSKLRQAEAMQKIMQILFEIECTDQGT